MLRALRRRGNVLDFTILGNRPPRGDIALLSEVLHEFFIRKRALFSGNDGFERTSCRKTLIEEMIEWYDPSCG